MRETTRRPRGGASPATAAAAAPAGPGGGTRAERRGAEGEPGTRQPAPAPLGGASARGGAPAVRRHHLALLPGPGVSLRSPAPGGSCAREETRGSGRPRGADPTPAPRRRAPGRDAAAPRSHARPPRPPSLGRLPRRRRAPPPAPGTDGGAQGRTTERPRSPLPARARADGQRAGGGTADPRPAATPRPEGGAGLARRRRRPPRGRRASAEDARRRAAPATARPATSGGATAGPAPGGPAADRRLAGGARRGGGRGRRPAGHPGGRSAPSPLASRRAERLRFDKGTSRAPRGAGSVAHASAATPKPGTAQPR